MPKIEVSDETYEKIKDQLTADDEDEGAGIATGEDVMVRTYSAGVFMGVLVTLKDKTCTLHKAIRIYYWDGACSLSQLAMEGTIAPDNCRFAMPVKEVLLNDVIEVLAVTAKAKKQIRRTKSWKK